MNLLNLENLDFGHGHGQNFLPFEHDYVELEILAVVMVKKFLTIA